MKKTIDMPLIVKSGVRLIEPTSTLEAHDVQPEITADELDFLEAHAK
ncbi:MULTISPECIES: hypothetical protein [Lysobacter]|uniref:Uncharacterized protein n=2 Tax=Lysobacter TaxID=68 RepID=A0A0S2DGT3_LYSEN|nr:MULTISPECIES: hypothetical protein [Lysobacter]ALN57737.1 hypothetical protein GLE_2388 [Lysobacter enzymogenes]QQP99140.1 hypothetical protein JHW41_13445 [Lysobacter enzymogenes]UZW58586.1 hypothetical protein BV903_014785 [Lysobacter enzymogenes]WMT02298.1 hypothetical protein RDV84_20370 [Lysobacter yananisis]SDY54919.1 hypothetical protein SAMN04487939_103128 [Lysobacter sp. yr284]